MSTTWGPISYGANAGRGLHVSLQIYRQHGDGRHRPFGLRQVDVLHALPWQPDERHDRRASGSRASSSTTAMTCTDRASTGSRSDAGSGWCSRSPIRSPSRSSTTWPGPRATSGMKRDLARARRGARCCDAALWDEVKDRLQVLARSASPGAGQQQQPLHRPRDRRRARRAAARRTRLRPGSDRDESRSRT